MARKSKTLATWLAVVAGTFGAHRFYLHGVRDVWAWLHPWPTLAGIAGVVRMDNLGQDDRAAWILAPALGLMLAAAMLAAIVYGLTPDERWNARFNADVSPSPATRWGPILGVIVALMIGSAALMATLAFSGQRFFEWQVDEARKISQ
jgi:TM2 domain